MNKQVLILLFLAIVIGAVFYFFYMKDYGRWRVGAVGDMGGTCGGSGAGLGGRGSVGGGFDVSVAIPRGLGGFSAIIGVKGTDTVAYLVSRVKDYISYTESGISSVPSSAFVIKKGTTTITGADYNHATLTSKGVSCVWPNDTLTLISPTAPPTTSS